MMLSLLLSFILILLVAYYRQKCLQRQASKISTSGFGIGDTNTNVKKTSLPIPAFSIKDVLWTIFVEEGKTSHFLQRNRLIGFITEVKLWSSRYVFINDYKLGLEIFKDSVANGRPKFTPHSHYGLSGSYGSNWKDQRKFCLRHLKALGFGTKSMESIIQEQVNILIESWRSLKSERFSPNKVFYVPILSTIWKLCTGDTISIKDQELFEQICLAYECLLKLYKFPNFLAPSLSKLSKLKFIKWLVQLLPVLRVAKIVSRGLSKIRLFIRNTIQHRKNLVNVAKVPENLIEAYLIKMLDTTDEDSNFFGVEGERNLQAVILDFFLAGGDSAATTLSWAMLHLIRNPQIQEKIRVEIDTVVGNRRQPTIEDRCLCPYTEACICEVLRFSPFGLASFAHLCLEDIEVGAHVIQKDSLLFLNIYGIQHDPKEFNEPEVFKPERFLSDDGTTLLKNTALCAFSLGQRRCLGEQLARDSLFLFVSTICQRFVLLPDPLLNGKIPSLADQKSCFHVPETFFMVAKER